MKKLIFFVVALALASSSAYAKKVRYIYTDNKFDQVKIIELGKKELKDVTINQPYTFDDQKMRDVLASVKLNRTFLVKEKIEERRVFDEAAVNFLTPKLIEAFKLAGPREKVIISFLNVDPKILFRTDRLIILDSWMEGNDLHIKFYKLFSRPTGDYTKRGDLAKTVERSRGLRISLEVEDGQELSDKDVAELIVHLDHDFSDVDKTEMVITKKPTKKELERKAKADALAAATAAAPIAADLSVEKRLDELRNLYDKKLITKREYEKKRKEILSGL